MIKKPVIAIVAIIAAVILVFAAYGGTGNNGDNNSVNNSSDQKDQQISQNDKKNNGIENKSTEKTLISASQAQKNAQKYIKDEGAKTGTPKLGKINGNDVYFVPVIKNNQTVGEIYIDAHTGENTGGAGSA